MDGYGKKVRMLLYYASVITILITLLSCAVTPRVSVWQSPKRFTQKTVFNAALQAGSDQGMQLAASDRESGTMSFRKLVGKGEMILSVKIQNVHGVVKVLTTASYGGRAAIRGLHEEFLNNFHVFLFRNLGISDTSEKNISIEELN